MSYTIEVENILHQAYIHQLKGDTVNCLKAQLRAMNILDAARANTIGNEYSVISTKLNHIAEEFNMIRSMNPTVDIQISEEQMNIDPSVPQMAIPIQGGSAIPDSSIAKEMITVTEPRTFIDSVNNTVDEAIDNIKQWEREKQVKEKLQKCVEDGKESMKNGYENTKEWIHEHKVVEKTITGLKYLFAFILKGILIGSTWVAKEVKELINKNTVENTESIVSPTEHSEHDESVAYSLSSSAGSIKMSSTNVMSTNSTGNVFSVPVQGISETASISVSDINIPITSNVKPTQL